MDESLKEDEQWQPELAVKVSDFALNADKIRTTIQRGVPYLKTYLSGREGHFQAALLWQVAKDVAASPQNLVVGVGGAVPGEWYMGIIRYRDNDWAHLTREPVWELSYQMAVFLIDNDRALPENADKKYCAHCSYWVLDTDVAVLGLFGERRTVHKLCFERVSVEGRPLGELIPPHRKTKHGRG